MTSPAGTYHRPFRHRRRHHNLRRPHLLIPAVGSSSSTQPSTAAALTAARTEADGLSWTLSENWNIYDPDYRTATPGTLATSELCEAMHTPKERCS